MSDFLTLQLIQNVMLVFDPSFLLHRQELEDEMAIMNERVQKLGELICLKSIFLNIF